jgi:hypothetical protein
MIFLIHLITALGTISGTVCDAETGKPIPLVNLSVVGTTYGASTNSLGEFSLRLPPGEYRIKIKHVGYKAKFVDAKVLSGEKLELSTSLQKEAIELEQMEVLGKHVVEPSFRMLEAGELKKIPFAELDFFRTIQALPGVAFVSDLIGWLYVRGGMPEENLYLMDGAEILCPHHYFGIVSALNVNLLKDVRFSCGGFSPCYGDKLSAVLDVRTRDGTLERAQATAEIDLLEAGVQAEFPVTRRCSYVFSARKNYFGTIAPLVGMGEGVILPDYRNFQNKLSFLIDKNHKISLSSLLLQDKASADVAGLGEEAALEWSNVANTYVFNYTNRFTQTTIYRSDLDMDAKSAEHVGDIAKQKQIAKIGIRQTCEFKFWENYKIRCGITFSDIDYCAMDAIPVQYMGFDQFGEWIMLTADVSTSQFGTYLIADIPVLDKVLLSLGSRFDHFSLTEDNILSPRIRLSYSWDPKTSFSLAWGHYHQFPAYEFLTLAPDLGPALANHYVIGVERDIGRDITARVEIYDKKVTNLAYIDLGSITADNSGHGSSRGVETFLRKSFADNFFGWVSCSFSRARRTGLFDSTMADFDADQPFALNIIGVYTFGKYAASATYRHTSGMPYTPVAGSTWDKGEWHHVGGLRNSARYPAYDRLDIRLEREFCLLGASGSFYFTVLNVFQHRNVQLYVYHEHYRQPIYMLPRLPFFGVKFNL